MGRHWIFYLLIVVLGGGAGMVLHGTPPEKPSDQDADAFVFPEPAGVPAVLPKVSRAPKAMVTAAHPLAAKMGTDILKAGGNAIDATVAVQMALAILEPQSSGLGGGCFIVFWDAKTQTAHTIDGREETPRQSSRKDFLDDQGQLLKDRITGGHCVGVPGTVAAVHLAHARWGKLPWKQVLQPAIRLAEEGVGISPRLRGAIESNYKRLARFPSSRSVFFHEDGSVPELSELRRYPELARTLRLIAEQGPSVFYEGEIAQKIVDAVQKAPYRPGYLSLEDLRQYRAVERQPARFKYRHLEIVGMPPPSSGTLTLGLMLGMLEPMTSKEWRESSPWQRAALFAQLENVAFADRQAYMGDADWCDWPQDKLLEPGRLEQRRQVAWKLKPSQKAKPGPAPGMPASPPNPDKTLLEEGTNTTHFSIVDADRNVVSCTTTIEYGMGSGLIVPGAGFLLNNELTDFDLSLPEGANALTNERRPRRSALQGASSMGGKRPRSSMCPIIVFRDGKPIMSVGSPGGAYIIGIVAHCLLGVVDDGFDIQDAINQPRVSCRNRGILELEEHFPDRAKLVQELEKRGWKVAPIKTGYESWGGAHGIVIRPDGMLEGGADPRREGAVRGY